MARGAFPDDHPLCLGHAGHARQLHRRSRRCRRATCSSRWAAASTTASPARSPGSPRTPRSSTSTSTPPSSARCAGPTSPIVGDCRLVIEELVKAVRALLDGGSEQFPDRSAWKSTISRLAGAYPLAYEPHEDGEPLKPQMVLEHLRDSVPEDTILCSGVGQHQMWASQYWKFRHPYTWVNSGGLGTMGFSVPAAIGAKVGRPDRMVWAVDGDGCFQMTAQELVTAVVRAHPGQGGDPQQRLPRHGPPVAGDVLRRALLRGVPVARPARLREVGRGDGLRRRSGSSRPRRSSRPSTRPTRSTTARSWSSSAPTAAEKVFPMVAGRQVERRDPGAGLPARTEGALTWPSRPAPRPAGPPRRTTPSRCWSRTRPACWPASPTCSPAGATTSSRWPSRRPTTSASAASRSWSTSSRRRSSRSSSSSHKLVNVVKISELDPRTSVERELLLATVEAGPADRAARWSSWPSIFEGRILAVSHEPAHRVARGPSVEGGRLRGAAGRPFGIVELQRTGRVALPKLEREARRLHSVPLDRSGTTQGSA